MVQGSNEKNHSRAFPQKVCENNRHVTLSSVRLKTSHVLLNFKNCCFVSYEVFPVNAGNVSIEMYGIWKSTFGIFKGFLCNRILLWVYLPFVSSWKAIDGLGGEGKVTSKHEWISLVEPQWIFYWDSWIFPMELLGILRFFSMESLGISSFQIFDGSWLFLRSFKYLWILFL